jgi:hypothetical protein
MVSTAVLALPASAVPATGSLVISVDGAHIVLAALVAVVAAGVAGLVHGARATSRRPRPALRLLDRGAPASSRRAA